MIISIYGAGYVGLVSAACFAKLGHQVVCADVNEARVARLQLGECPIYETNLPELLNEQMQQGRLQFTCHLKEAIHASDVHFIATGTPALDNGQADLTQVFDVATSIARNIAKNALLVIKSTVPTGTSDALESHASDVLKQLNKPHHIEVASNPEFLREGCAVNDFMHAERIIIGGSESALNTLETLYDPLVAKGVPIIRMNRRSAELSKYASNVMLACKISFINQISRIAEALDANITEICQGMGMDHRIGPAFLNAGIGYGGSCFPKDVKALIHVTKSLKLNASLFDAIDDVNQQQKYWPIERLNEHFQNQLQDRVIGLWGLSFKPGTDDVREASSLVIINALLQAGAKLRVYDPVAVPHMKAQFSASTDITWCETANETLMISVDALVIATEWDEFKTFPLPTLAHQLQDAPLIDGRNCYSLSDVKRAGIAYYYSVGRTALRFSHVKE